MAIILIVLGAVDGTLTLPKALFALAIGPPFAFVVFTVIYFISPASRRHLDGEIRRRDADGD